MITIIGPTASGKTALAARLAHKLGSEVISADSRQVYRGMDIGTGKDLQDYQIDGVSIPYHLIDIISAGSRYSIYDYQRDFHALLPSLKARLGQMPAILCGGSGLYVESILSGYHLPGVPPNEEIRKHLAHLDLRELKDLLQDRYGIQRDDLDTVRRAIRAIEVAEGRTQGPITTEVADTNPQPQRTTPISSTIICLDLEREERRKRITTRLNRRLKEGMTEEVEHLLQEGISADRLISYGLEYKWVTLYVLGSIDRSTMVRQLEIAIHQFAKRQMTWFRGMERRGFRLHYLDATLPVNQLLDLATRLIELPAKR